LSPDWAQVQKGPDESKRSKLGPNFLIKKYIDFQ